MQRSLRRVILCCWWIVFWLKKSMLNWTSLYKAQNNIYFRRIKLYSHPLKSHCNRTKHLENIEFLFSNVSKSRILFNFIYRILSVSRMLFRKHRLLSILPFDSIDRLAFWYSKIMNFMKSIILITNRVNCKINPI